MTIDPDRGYGAVLHAAAGDISIELLPSVAPVAVNNFVHLARDGFYHGTTFHRVVPGFLAQAGDPGGSGRGGPGYRFADEISDIECTRGMVGMANAGPNTNGSQFFILLADAPQLRGRYTVFGRVTAGLEVADELTARDPSADTHAGDRIESIDIVEG